MKALKRVRYGEKELIKLKNIVANASNASIDVKNFKTITTNENNMEVDAKQETGDCGEVSRSSRTKRDANGHYPVWMNGRQIRKMKTKLKRIKSKHK